MQLSQIEMRGRIRQTWIIYLILFSPKATKLGFSAALDLPTFRFLIIIPFIETTRYMKQTD